MNNCPCCSHQLLRHIRRQEIYYFCRTCWLEMPVLKQTYYPKTQANFIDKTKVLL
ncbi:hypothetical protein H6H03_21035 [Nostoc paludosum FACHB-159]|uniref:Uncharacterized protein n=1 Tax=Nostoc paludosum FACHB-159 TaxID=2692908 RepID=A0ABR8KA03_9NOSO|nr:hypothetical protein [Nostoc paludosum]MBD2736341.1 hypothetical protein [Nostoc paludosum FACHB-159]MDZ8106132.1 hypothetical protein [Nostoc sp. DedQUE12a]